MSQPSLNTGRISILPQKCTQIIGLHRLGAEKRMTTRSLETSILPENTFLSGQQAPRA